MRRPGKGFRKAPQSSWSEVDHMGALPQSPTLTSLRGRDTGFPEPFCSQRNTSLPHPEANLAPGASITEADVAAQRAVARHRLSFMINKEHERERLAGTSTGTSPSPVSFTPELHREARMLADDGSLNAIAKLAFTSLDGVDITRQLGGSGEHRSSKDVESLTSGSGSEMSGGRGHPDSPTQSEQPIIGGGGGERKSSPRDGSRRKGILRKLINSKKKAKRLSGGSVSPRTHLEGGTKGKKSGGVRRAFSERMASWRPPLEEGFAFSGLSARRTGFDPDFSFGNGRRGSAPRLRRYSSKPAAGKYWHDRCAFEASMKEGKCIS
ncbi:hypothetical protein B0T22DRAFT_442070 [Podospora appendiculata]|uniref:Uncharacterized protein n=1 Tax=Podospora appendiculata TaxID=314037 RepID=A0AAE0X473_9PEZI|nr:hypothetical protein B0T22DRAFT_442070 [Podospora appendiculata]